ncbi:uncharacterized protein PgNI_09520 [Pyricularia grisea]|uniref:Uncharacterized protein n=1 Tax=Pyricularia grisea TaxID=148305 RepID=A0A6P8ATH1_PYRGI|nr:uncharacterized protein PgNI_09520 [Pyricularia grisea]TLD05413.1 hypothetical protein PgNI_09520 [Pyricularia grisea]
MHLNSTLLKMPAPEDARHAKVPALSSASRVASTVSSLARLSKGPINDLIYLVAHSHDVESFAKWYSRVDDIPPSVVQGYTLFSNSCKRSTS